MTDAQKKTADSKINVICLARYSPGVRFTVSNDKTKQNNGSATPSHEALPMANHDNMVRKNKKLIKGLLCVFTVLTHADWGVDNRSSLHILFSFLSHESGSNLVMASRTP
ncbi:hypothetical protein [Edwardsiella hoshinae]|uniref:hypothetical protein n=1 Tax=Edwardsiella hoshinae TaxID=93378 RepID=UPI00155938D6|nr:hypothetical protein [Edwardsiella hoshinae]